MKFRVDSTLQQGLDQTPTVDMTLTEIARMRREQPPQYQPLADVPGVDLAEVRVPGLPRMMVYTPQAAQEPGPAILHCHGGGYMYGLPEGNHLRNAELCRDLGAVVVSPEYRKAPEHPFPAALDDMRAVWRWLLDQAGDMQIDTGRIAVLGESAGGGLAASLVLALRDESDIQPRFQALIYPMLDDRTGSTRPWNGPRHHVWTAASNVFGWQSYLGHAPGLEGTSGLAAPGRHPDLSGLPPTWIGTGDIDLFAPENLAFATALVTQGVPCELLMVPGAYHGFRNRVPDSPVSRRFDDACAEALKTALCTTA
ncbi:alpha/beta hydrolase [Pseudooceanicola sp. C21-150M6]|uniref:alpha/beta hydrolase n=1 Tax=Pseudooceanicola sp. C21-150M6 TaxID=3434355 RepID=UPI003D7FE2CB